MRNKLGTKKEIEHRSFLPLSVRLKSAPDFLHFRCMHNFGASFSDRSRSPGEGQGSKIQEKVKNVEEIKYGKLFLVHRTSTYVRVAFDTTIS